MHLIGFDALDFFLFDTISDASAVGACAYCCKCAPLDERYHTTSTFGMRRGFGLGHNSQCREDRKEHVSLTVSYRRPLTNQKSELIAGIGHCVLTQKQYPLGRVKVA